MYTLYISDENDVTVTVKETIMQRSSCVNQIQFLVNRYYQDTVDMGDATVYLKYLLPSGKLEMVELTANTLSYNDEDVIQYVLTADTAITAESGDVTLSFTFLKVVAAEDGTTTTYVRKTQEGTIYITPVVQFENFIPDDMLNAIDQRLIVLATQISDLNALNQEIYDNAVNDIQISEDNSKLILANNSGTIGDGVDIDELANLISSNS